MADDWFRGGDWTPAAQEHFEAKLARARPASRPQYLRIKGLGLNEAGDVAGARSLWNRVLGDPASDWVQLAPATEHLADSYYSESPEIAAAYYRRVTELSPTLSATTGTHHIKLAQLLLDTGTEADLAEVGDLLTWWVDNAKSPFPSAHFSWNIAYIKWALALGDDQSARAGAQRALEWEARGPVFSRHPTVGLVEADAGTLDWLRSLAG